MMTQTGAMLVALSQTMRKLHHPHFEANKKSLQSLRARHNVAFALHLPEKSELSDRAWSAQSMEIKSFVLASKLPYVDGLERCRLDAADYGNFDTHPTPAGYRKIRKCVSELIKATPFRTSSLRP